MPSNRSINLLALLLVVFGLTYLLTSDPKVAGREPPPDAISRLETVDASTVNAVEISQGSDSLSIERDGDGWVATSRFGVAADRVKVSTLIDLILLISAGQKRASSDAAHQSFEVDSENGYRIQMRGEGEGLPIDVTIGKVDGFDRVYARFDDGADVYSVLPNLRYGAGLSPKLRVDDWLDLIVLEIPEEDEIASFRFETEDRSILLEHLESETETPDGEPATTVNWTVTAPETFEADPAIVRGLVSSVQQVRANTVVDPASISETGLESPTRLLTISLKNGEAKVLEFGGEGEIEGGQKVTYGRLRGDPRIFGLPTWTVSNLLKTLDQLRPAPPEPVDPPQETTPAPEGE